MGTFRVTALHHIQLAIPKGGEAQARAFYCDRLGMEEEPKPSSLRVRGGTWLRAGSLRLHLGVEEPFHPARKAHPALIVTDLAAAHEALADVQTEGQSTLPGLTRFFVADPFGNRIEIIQLDND